MSLSRRQALRFTPIVVLPLLLAACNKSGAPAAGGPPMKPPEVTVVTIKPGQVSLFTELAGRTAPYQIAEVRPQVTGIIKQRQFKEGGDVRQGAPLYQIDPATYDTDYNSARAALAKVEANVTTVKLKADRYKELVSIDAVSKQANDDAAAALRQAEADVTAARAAVERARINLAYTRVVAPISGRIGRSGVTPGALVTANQATAMATIQQLDPIYVDVTQSSAELLRLRRDLAAGKLKSGGAGQAVVKLVLEDGSTYGQTGKLQFSEVSVDQQTGSVTLRAVFPNPKQELLPGMYVRAILEEGVREDAIVVPQQGVTRDAKGNAVALVVGAENKVEPRILRTSRALGDRWLVDEGLKAGDRLIVEGLQKVRPGAPATPIEQAAVAPKPPGGAPGAAPAQPAAGAAAPAKDAPAAPAASR